MVTEPKSVLITGCTPGGIGHALALAFQSKGFRVFATARSVEKIKPLADKGIEILELDVTKAESISKAKAHVEKSTGGRLDILVNNAGIWLESPALDTDISTIKAMFDTNLFGPMEMVRQFTPLLLLSKGTIVNNASITGIMPYAFTSAYNGSKAALAQYSETLRLELEPLDVKVITVVTGQVASNLPTVPTLQENSIYLPVKSALEGRAKTHIDKTMSPDVYAAALVKHVSGSSPKPWFWKGTNATITWIVSTFAPKTAFDFLMKKISGLDKAKREILNRAIGAWSSDAVA